MRRGGRGRVASWVRHHFGPSFGLADEHVCASNRALDAVGQLVAVPAENRSGRRRSSRTASSIRPAM